VIPGRTWPVLVPMPTYGQRALQAAVDAKRKIFQNSGKTPALPGREPEKDLSEAMSMAGCAVEMHHYPDSTLGLQAAMDSLKSAVVLPCHSSLGSRFPHPWVGYIADLQHKRVPGNFSQTERQGRDRQYRALLADARVVVVNSRSVVEDIREFYPDSTAELIALPFCPPVSHMVLTDLDVEELKAYALPKRYFVISNQFWTHKSHKTAFDALRRVQSEGHNDVQIICTGNQHDYRFPGYVEELKEGIQRDGLGEHVRFLGIVPKMHQLAIMQRSAAVIQPTLFEGGPGGGALYDAISVSAPVILSDIAVNREADIGVIEFFRAGSAEDLASIMIKFLQNPPDRPAWDETIKVLKLRRKKMGETLIGAAKLVTQGSSSLDGWPIDTYLKR